jgi:hypothetical protein
VFRHEGNTSGQGISDETEAADDVDDADDTGTGKTDSDPAGGMLSVTGLDGAGVFSGGAGTRVVGGALLHFVQTVTVAVTTVSVIVTDVVTTVYESEVLVIVTGNGAEVV